MAQLSSDTERLVRLIDARLDEEDWTFQGESETDSPGGLFLASSMRHSARLLSEVDAAHGANLTFAARMAVRTLYETLTLVVYLRFYPDAGYELVKSNFRARVNEAILAVEKLNEEIKSDAETRGEEHVPPNVSTKSLETLRSKLGTSKSKLPLEAMVRQIKIADTHGFFGENMRRPHLVYRAVSMFAPHTNYWVLKGYTYGETGGSSVPTLSHFGGHDSLRADRLGTLHITACVAILVLENTERRMTDAHEIVDFYGPFVGTDY